VKYTHVPSSHTFFHCFQQCISETEINPDSKSAKKKKAIEKLLYKIQSTALCREKY
jgi:hypothetical protein